MSDAEHYGALQPFADIEVRAPPPPPPPAPGAHDSVTHHAHGPADDGIQMAVAAAAAAAAAHQHDGYGVSHHQRASIQDDEDVLNLDGDEDGLPRATSSAATATPAQESIPAQSEEQHTYPPAGELEALQFTDADLLTAELHKLATRHGFVITKLGSRRNGELGQKPQVRDHSALLVFPADPAEEGTSVLASEEVPSNSGDKADWLRSITWGCSSGIRRKAADPQTGHTGEEAENDTCKWRLRVTRSAEDQPFALQLTRPFHNHPASETIQKTRLYRLQKADKARIWNLYFHEGFRPRHLQSALSNEHRVITSRQVEDFVHNWRAMAPTDQVKESMETMNAARQRMKSLNKDEQAAQLHQKTAALEDESTPAMEHALQITSGAERKRMMESSNIGKTGKGRNYKRNDLQPREKSEKPQGARAHKKPTGSTRRRQRGASDGQGDAAGVSATGTPDGSAPPAKKARTRRGQTEADPEGNAAATSKSDADKWAATEKARLAAEAAYYQAFSKAMEEAGMPHFAPHSLPPPIALSTPAGPPPPHDSMRAGYAPGPISAPDGR